ncbi:hypothetical protein PHMEG_00024290 [Phytophthora megakarya]|uniref:Expansin-like EG45 domain-containing protein n=1 Tax=Phytophthora megakarya TaxID=4795 RepID=A0A225VEE8_9STRA|nr:hypothetical protein PHMEG_00024290 [Phytophthora megakarya]
MVAVIRFTAVLLGTMVEIASAADEYFEGDGTSYTLGQVSSGNCNFMSVIPSASTNYVALNQAQWESLGNCGRCIEVSCIDEQCTANNKTAVVQVLDRCPECAHGALDLSPTVYKEITGLDPNRLTVRWRFVDCPDPGTLQVCLKEGSNANWIAIQPTNGVVGVKSVTINGASTTMLDGAYYFVSTDAGDLSAVKVAVTSVNGDVISGTYAMAAGKCTDTNKQFGSGSSSQSQEQQQSYTPAPETTTTTPTTTTAPIATSASSPTAPTQTYSSGASVESSNEQDFQTGQSSKTDETQDEASSSATSTVVTPGTPETTPATPEATTAAPQAPATPVTPEATSAVPTATTAPTDAPTQSSDTSKCQVRRRS